MDKKFEKIEQNKVVEQITEKAEEVLADERQPGKVRFPLGAFWVVGVLTAQTGRTDACSIADYWNIHRKELFSWCDDVSDDDISPDTVLRLMKLLDAKQASELIKTFIKNNNLETLTDEKAPEGAPTVMAIDGQSVRASRVNGNRCGHILNLFNCDNNQLMGQVLIGSKRNEVSATPELLEPYDLEGTIVTADALFAKSTMVEAITSKGADYCIPVKNNAKVVKKEIDKAFARVQNAGPDDESLPKIKHIQYDIELEHGRIERREVDVLPGKLLPRKLQERWVGLEDGCIVLYKTYRYDKKGKTESTEVKRVVSSLPWDTENVAAILGWTIRRHWAIENELHWQLDVAFRQDRIQRENGRYLHARTILNKIALNLLRKHQRATNSDKSLERLMVEMNDLSVALDCLRLNAA